MKKVAASFSLIAFILVVLAGSAFAAPSKIPPVSLGPKTLTGDGSPPTAYEFFLQAGSSWKGDIGGIAAGPTYSLIILDIDLTGVTGPAGRQVYFNLQDAESGSTFKHLGISVRLQDTGAGGRALLQCYQSFTSEGLSSHGFNAGELTENNLDLRFDFTKAASGDVWHVIPYYRLSGGSWTLFFDGAFNGTVAFNFLGAKLAVAFDGGADGTVGFSNYYLSGPAPSKTYVDDAWIGYAGGTGVQFPGETEYRTIGIDAFATVQGGVDAVASSGTVYAAAGSYTEQVEIAKNATLSGAGTGTVIVSPNVLTKFWGTNKPVIYIHDAGNVIVKDLVVDGAGKGNANSRFIGIGFHNAGGKVANCTVKNIQDTPLSGAQHGVALYAYEEDGTGRVLAVWDNVIFGFQKNAMALMSNTTTALTVDVLRNTVTGAGATSVTAQNGIQIGSGYGSNTNGTVADNTVSGIGYSGSGWVATSLLQYYGDVDFIGNTVTNGHMGIYNNYGAGDIMGNNITVSMIGSYCDGIIAADPVNKVASPFNPDAQVGAPGIRIVMGGTPLDINVTGNTVAFSGPTNTGSYGIEAYAGYSPEDLDVAINGNDVSGFDYGIVFSQCTGTGCDTGVFTGLRAQYNSIIGNATYGMYSDVTYLDVDATLNWWGDATGPLHSTKNPSGAGDEVTDYILFDPWFGSPNEISVVPSSTLTNCTTPKTVTFHIDQAGIPDEVRGYDVKFQITSTVVNVTSPGTDVVEKEFLKSVAGTSFYVVNNGGGTYTVSCAILGGDHGGSGHGDLFTVLLTPVAQGTCDIAFVSIKVRDLNNAPLTSSGVKGAIQVDCSYPTMEPIVEPQNIWYNAAPVLSNFGFDDDVNLDLAQYKIDAGGWTTLFSGIDATSWDNEPWTLPGFGVLSEGTHVVYFRVKDDAGNMNGEGGSQPNLYSWKFRKDTTVPAPPTDFVAMPGHDKTHLTWTNPTGDPTFNKIEIRFNPWADYPEYGTPGPPAPSYPADHTLGTFAALVAGASYDDSPRTSRDIYYYAAFSKDSAGNYSSLGPTAKDRTTSYWLGDIDADGYVKTSDLVTFSSAFGTSSGGGGWDNTCDFGPTDDWSRFGIPLPDNTIDFEDLMVFSMNWAKVAPAGMAMLVAARVPEDLSSLVRFEIVPGNENVFSVVLKSRATTLKGIHCVVEAEGKVVQIMPGSLIVGRSDVFFGTLRGGNSSADICIAALGTDAPLLAEATGEIARFTVAPGEEPVVVRFKAIDLRNLDNKRTEVAVTYKYEAPFVPKATALMQNFPNPFNPTTVLTYDVASAGQVTIRVFDVSGRLIRTLLDARKEIGRHQVEWNGKNASGSMVPSGIYFYRMRTSGFDATRKMILLR